MAVKIQNYGPHGPHGQAGGREYLITLNYTYT